MPMLDLELPAGAVAPDALAGLLDDLTTVFLAARGLPDTPEVAEATGASAGA
jgi:hypothetical protein